MKLSQAVPEDGDCRLRQAPPALQPLRRGAGFTCTLSTQTDLASALAGKADVAHSHLVKIWEHWVSQVCFRYNVGTSWQVNDGSGVGFTNQGGTTSSGDIIYRVRSHGLVPNTAGLTGYGSITLWTGDEMWSSDVTVPNAPLNVSKYATVDFTPDPSCSAGSVAAYRSIIEVTTVMVVMRFWWTRFSATTSRHSRGSRMRYVILTALLGTTLWGARAISTGGFDEGKITLPQSGGVVAAPYNAIAGTRVEIRLSEVRPCIAGGDGNIFKINNLFGLSCTTTGGTQIGHFNISGTETTSIRTYAPGSDLIFRIQRWGGTNPRFGYEVWNADGTGYVNLSYDHPNATRNADLKPWASEIVGYAGGVNIAWIRWYSTTVPEGSSMPKDNAPPADLGDWEFENSLADSSGHGLTVSKASPVFVNSTVYAPVVQIAAPLASAGKSVTLSGSESFTYDGSGLSDYLWQQVSGPSTVEFSDRRAANPTVTGLVAGDYQFQLTITAASGASITRTVTINVANSDINGNQLFPVVLDSLASTEVAFRLADVPGATQVRITVRKPDGRDLPPVTCTESPCTVKVDNRQSDHLIKLEYLSSSGRSVRRSNWQLLAVNQVAQPSQFGIYNRMAIINYTADDRQGAYLTRMMQFQGSKYDIQYGGKSLVPYMTDPDGISVSYIDLVAIYMDSMYTLKQVAKAHGYKYEDMLLHMDADYDFEGVPDAAKYVWNTRNRFDACESWNDSEGLQTGTGSDSAGSANGVFTWTSAGG